MDHHLGVGASGWVEGYEDKYYYGRRANGIYIPRYRNYGSDKRDYLRGFGYQGGGNRGGWRRSAEEVALGMDLKEELSEPGRWSMGMGGFGETLPYHENKITLDKQRKIRGLNVRRLMWSTKRTRRKCAKTCLMTLSKCSQPA